MNAIFDQTMSNDPDAIAAGRASLKVIDEGDLDFTETTNATEAADGQNFLDKALEEVRADIRRGSTLKTRKASIQDNVNLEDFDIILQLGKGTFGKVYLATLPSKDKKYAIKAIRKDVLIEYD